ncbi:hypothetical protein BELL_1225g00020 [Botrytis elliptica]|uniref:Uncharacterized protein n=1 Tax=Botrytis elliptica TaxID=278938 RepID=A0A4Z1IE37_9HELO|nr:hypothetical protein BELL_1225g00020 [Botrytis elliptica]
MKKKDSIPKEAIKNSPDGIPNDSRRPDVQWRTRIIALSILDLKTLQEEEKKKKKRERGRNRGVYRKWVVECAR